MLDINGIKISLNNANHNFDDLEDIVIGISCIDAENKAELYKFLLFYRDFLPQHFKLVIFSDLELSTDSSVAICSLKDALNRIANVDLFVCIEEPQLVSYLLYLCVCDNIPIYAKSKEFATHDLITSLENFTFIPKEYQSFLDNFIFKTRANKKSKSHDSCQLFLEYWLNSVDSNITNSAVDYSLVP